MRIKEADNIFALLRSALYGETLPKDFSPNWEYIEKCMKFSMLSPILSVLPDEINKKINNNSEDNLMIQIYQNLVINTIKQISKTAMEREIPFAVLKGIVLGIAYPDASTRATGDIDFYVRPEMLYSFSEILEEMGAVLEDCIEEGQRGVMKYKFQNGIVVEIHAYLAMSLTQRQSAVLSKNGMFHTNEFILIEVDDMELPTLDLTNQLVYMIYHIGKHFAFGSANIRMLLDVSVYADHYNSKINKRQLRSMLNELGFEKFANAIFSLCKNKLGMNYDVWDVETPSHERRFIKDLTGCYYHGLSKIVNVMEVTNSANEFSKNKARQWRVFDVFRNINKVLRKVANPYVVFKALSQYKKQWYWNLNNTDRKSMRKSYE